MSKTRKVNRKQSRKNKKPHRKHPLVFNWTTISPTREQVMKGGGFSLSQLSSVAKSMYPIPPPTIKGGGSSLPLSIAHSISPKPTMRGGSSLSTAQSISPQSFLPFNNFSQDPNYSVIASRNTGPFLTGISSGGSRRRQKQRRMRGGSTNIPVANAVNNSQPINEAPGVASNVLSGFSGTPSIFSSTPLRIAPLA
jgi:hypothetical protein